MLQVLSKYHPSQQKSTAEKWKSYSDSYIWRMFRKGHEGAFDHIYSKYFPVLYQYGYRITPSRELVLDCIQDLFIDLIEKGKELKTTDCIKYYLYKCLRNKILYQLRKLKKEHGKEHLENQNFKVQVSHEVKIIEQSIDEEKRLRLKESLSKLPIRQKEAIFYFYQEGFTYEEVASIMGFKEIKSARNIIYKAIRLLQKDIAG